jgi:transcriptional regulator with XRE-family HTH domain
MSDVLTVPDDDLFWPPTERTEAESSDIASKPDAWIFTYLGTRVLSFSPSPDRVIVWCAPVPTVDAFALPAGMRGFADLYGPWRVLPRSWEPSLITYLAFTEVVPSLEASLSHLNPVTELDDSPAGSDDVYHPGADLEQAVTTIKQLLGLTDEQLEAATKVSRSTLWRLRTRRTGEARSVTEAPIWRLHGVARAMTARLGAEGVRSWLHAGDPSPVALLRSGELGLFERAADGVLFSDHVSSRPAAAVTEDDYAPVMPQPAALKPTKRPRRVRRPGDRSS